VDNLSTLVADGTFCIVSLLRMIKFTLNNFYNSVTKILVAVRLGFLLPQCDLFVQCVRWTSASVVCDYEPHRSAVAEHNIDCHHRVLQNTRFLAKESKSRERFKRKAIEVHLDPNNIKREDGFLVRKSGNLLIHWRKERNQSFLQGRDGFVLRGR
jgi:hypothetical protein